MQATLSTKRLRLRPWTGDDTEKFHEIWGDPEVIFWGASQDLAATSAMLDRIMLQALKGCGWWAVERGDETVVGNVLIRPATAAEGHELGWHFKKRFQKRGYATEATRALTRHGFDNLGVERAVAYVLPDNRPSQRVAEKVGLQRVGELIYADLLHDLWAVTLDEWRIGGL